MGSVNGCLGSDWANDFVLLFCMYSIPETVLQQLFRMICYTLDNIVTTMFLKIMFQNEPSTTGDNYHRRGAARQRMVPIVRLRANISSHFSLFARKKKKISPVQLGESEDAAYLCGQPIADCFKRRYTSPQRSKRHGRLPKLHVNPLSQT